MKADIRVPLDTTAEENSGLNRFSICDSKICNNKVEVEDCGDDIADWLYLALDIPNIRLVRLTNRKIKVKGNSTSHFNLFDYTR